MVTGNHEKHDERDAGISGGLSEMEAEGLGGGAQDASCCLESWRETIDLWHVADGVHPAG